MNKLLIAITMILGVYVLYSLVSPIDKEIRDSRVISNCWDEELKICKDENKGDECTFGVYKLCADSIPKCKRLLKAD